MNKLARAILFSLLACCIVSSSRNSCAQAQAPLPMMPLPAHAVSGRGQFMIDGSFGIKLEGYIEPRLVRARQRFLRTLSRQTGIPLDWEAQFNQPRFIVHTAGPSDPVQQLGEDESYHLEITPTQVRLSAANPLGVLHGLQTFLQLVRTSPQGFSVPAVVIDDQPRFPWRGLMIDSSRHFIPVPVLERDLNGMEAVKMNVFHWHLSDDQGFRAESRKFPLLQKDGSDGLYYTQDQIRQLIAYARDRGIRVVPEFDMPCHTSSWFVGYPNLGSAKGPYRLPRNVGILNAAMNPTLDSTYQFLDSFIGEMAALFPDEYFHIGGDECNGREWNANPQIQSFMRVHDIANNAALQAYFTARVQKIVANHHKIMEGWDEVLQPETPKDVVVESWRGLASLAQAARQGNRGVLATPYYMNLDHPTSYYYLADPLSGPAAALTPEQKARILGGEATIWTVFFSAENVNKQTWPYLAAIAERLWSPQQVRDVNSMYRRLAIVSMKLEYYGLNSNAVVNEMLQRMSGDPDPEPLKVLASVVAPPTGYKRYDLEGGKSYTVLTPLNRLVDAVPPESGGARRFHDLVQQIVAGNATPEQWQQARHCLTLWRDNDARLQPMLERSAITKELVPLSHGLNQVAEIGLQALDKLRNNQTITAAERQHELTILRAAEQPQAVLLDKVAPSVELLVQKIQSE